jgi:hypothetical protein
MARRNQTTPDTPDWTLTPQQELAVELLFSGKNLTEAAQDAGVTRQTVSEWYNHNPAFQAHLNSKRLELWNGASERLRAMLPTALDVLEHELTGEAKLTAAVHVIKICGLYSLSAPHGPTDPAEMARAMEHSDQHRLLQSLIY